MTRQAEWQKRKLAEGLCSRCGKRPLGMKSGFCDPCGLRVRILDRTRRGNKPWRKGFPGRPPFKISA